MNTQPLFTWFEALSIIVFAAVVFFGIFEVIEWWLRRKDE